MTEPTLKQWKRRALAAEAQISAIECLRRTDTNRELRMACENATLRVALQEVQDATNWAHGVVADKLGCAT